MSTPKYLYQGMKDKEEELATASNEELLDGRDVAYIMGRFLHLRPNAFMQWIDHEVLQGRLTDANRKQLQEVIENGPNKEENCYLFWPVRDWSVPGLKGLLSSADTESAKAQSDS